MATIPPYKRHFRMFTRFRLVDPVLIPRLTVAIEPSHYYRTNARIMCPISKIAG